MKPNKILLFTVGMLACASISQAVISPPSFFTFSSGTRAASADFSQSGGNLVVTLTNTFAGDVLVPTDVLTAVFFDISGSPALTPVSATVAGGSSVVYTTNCDVNPCAGATNVGGEWGFGSGLAPQGPVTGAYGLSSTGARTGLGAPNFPTGLDYQSPASLDGLQFGITSAGDNLATGNAGVTNSALIKNSVVFTLSGLGAGPYAISNVFFLYGTSIGGEDACPGGTCGGGGGGNPIPEPGYLLTLALLGVPVVLRYRKTRQLSA